MIRGQLTKIAEDLSSFERFLVKILERHCTAFMSSWVFQDRESLQDPLATLSFLVAHSTAIGNTISDAVPLPRLDAGYVHVCAGALAQKGGA